jgi:hypothetical protein
MKSNLFGITCFLGCIFLSGCLSRESRVPAAKMDPETMTQKCMDLVDADSDGLLTKAELKVTPGLLSALVDLDEDKDKQLSRDEIFKRFELYVTSRVGLQGVDCSVTINGRPLRDAHVDLIPEAYMAEFIEPAAGDVINENTGAVEISTHADLPGVRPGIYRVEITSPSVDIASKFNKETIYGMEVAPIQKENESHQFRVKKR